MGLETETKCRDSIIGCRNCKVFCERPFALQREQPEKDKQNVDFAHPWKNFCGHLWLLPPVQQALTYSLGKSGEANHVRN